MDSTQEYVLCEESSIFHYVSCDNSLLTKRWHYNVGFELHYFRSFSGIALVGDYAGELSSDSLFLLAPGVPHSWKGDVRRPVSDADRQANNSPIDFMILVPETAVSPSTNAFPELRAIEKMLRDSQFGIEFKNCSEIAKIGQLMLEIKNLEGCAKLGQFFLILDRLARCAYQKLSSLALFQQRDTFSNEALGRSMRYMNEHFKENITLEIVSQISNMSPAYFCRMFKKTYGVGFLNHINSLRIKYACALLRKTDNPISSIGYECGYPNTSNFNRNFRKYMGKSPSGFRHDGERCQLD